jgi:hypothetical protein
MFKRIVIELAGPICDCDVANISWQPTILDAEKRPLLTLTCETCGTKLVVASKKFVASFKFDKGYPGKKAVGDATKTDPKDPYDNVIPFPSKIVPPLPK